jgi:hypothetical protein
VFTKIGSETRGIDLYEENLWFWTIHGTLIGYPFSKIIYGIICLLMWYFEKNKGDFYTKARGRKFVFRFVLGLNVFFGNDIIDEYSNNII